MLFCVTPSSILYFLNILSLYILFFYCYLLPPTLYFLVFIKYCLFTAIQKYHLCIFQNVFYKHHTPKLMKKQTKCIHAIIKSAITTKVQPKIDTIRFISLLIFGIYQCVTLMVDNSREEFKNMTARVLLRNFFFILVKFHSLIMSVKFSPVFTFSKFLLVSV